MDITMSSHLGWERGDYVLVGDETYVIVHVESLVSARFVDEGT